MSHTHKPVKMQTLKEALNKSHMNRVAVKSR